jgi:hypothetical protein
MARQFAIASYPAGTDTNPERRMTCWAGPLLLASRRTARRLREQQELRRMTIFGGKYQCTRGRHVRHENQMQIAPPLFHRQNYSFISPGAS